MNRNNFRPDSLIIGHMRRPASSQFSRRPTTIKFCRSTPPLNHPHPVPVPAPTQPSSAGINNGRYHDHHYRWGGGKDLSQKTPDFGCCCFGFVTELSGLWALSGADVLKKSENCVAPKEPIVDHFQMIVKSQHWSFRWEEPALGKEIKEKQ